MDVHIIIHNECLFTFEKKKILKYKTHELYVCINEVYKYEDLLVIKFSTHKKYTRTI